MPENDQPKYPHIIARDTATSERYTSVLSGQKKFLPKSQDRQLHGAALRNQLLEIDVARQTLTQQREAIGVPSDVGITLQFESEPEFEVKLESLDNKKQGIQLLGVVRTEDEKTLATVSVPEGKIKHFFDLVNAYLEKDTPKGRPKHESLLANIAAIRLATLRALWTDSGVPFPADNEEVWWEVWLRVGKTNPEKENLLKAFREIASNANLIVTEDSIEFLERTVLLVRASPTQLSQSVFLLNSMAELRKADSAESFMAMTPREEAEWIQEALTRITPPPAGSPSVCILDTGINNGHPLIQPVLDTADMQTYNPVWGTTDGEGHGTQMAGLAAYGDLFEVLMSNEPIALSHRLESVKVLPSGGSNDPSLYGKIIAESVARSEVQAPDRQRAICMAITTADSRDRGQPSSWSAAVDQICSGSMEEDEPKRLMILSAGNADATQWERYPASNYTDGVHDPAQAWNALTVGAYTEKDYIDTTQWNGCRPLAPKGGLSPHSTTSRIWNRQWPHKPDIVLEGGNVAFNPGLNSAFQLDSLQLLSTYWQPASGLLTPMCATSASSALASRMAAIIMAKYPALWPETIRGLMVHSAQWTDQMGNGKDLADKSDIAELLRIGHGVPNLDDALWSAGNSLTLIAQDVIQPYFMEDKKVKTHELRLHALPWPKDVLAGLGNIEVQMRVTLSYFIEPNPGHRGWFKRFLYPSHGLRFHMKTGTETLDEFRRRINKVVREETADEYVETHDDSTHWLAGYKLRSRGSVHSDTWKGPAVTLAEKGFVAVFPVSGWWRERIQHARFEKQARYSLIVTIKTPPETVDIYTPVAVSIPIPITH